MTGLLAIALLLLACGGTAPTIEETAISGDDGVVEGQAGEWYDEFQGTFRLGVRAGSHPVLRFAAPADFHLVRSWVAEGELHFDVTYQDSPHTI